MIPQEYKLIRRRDKNEKIKIKELPHKNNEDQITYYKISNNCSHNTQLFEITHNLYVKSGLTVPEYLDS